MSCNKIEIILIKVYLYEINVKNAPLTYTQVNGREDRPADMCDYVLQRKVNIWIWMELGHLRAGIVFCD